MDRLIPYVAVAHRTELRRRSRRRAALRIAVAAARARRSATTDEMP